MKDNYPISVSVEEGIDLILKETKIISICTESVENLDGRVLAKDVVSKENIPPFRRSPLDGYAMRSEDIKQASKENPVTLKIIEEVPAGHVATKAISKGEAIKILTGATIPDSADCVIKFEDTEFDSEKVTVFAPLKSGQNVVPAGEDVKIGDIVVKKGTKLTPSQVGLLAGLGCDKVEVYKKPSVTLISTGDELVEVREELKPGKIRNSSAYNLNSILERSGLNSKMYGIVKDTTQEIGDAIKKAFESSDMVITTGGVSVGDYDKIKDAISYIGGKIIYWKTKMKPGSAFLAATYNDKLFFGLSGNPAAAAVALHIVCMPAIRKMCGIEEYQHKVIQVHTLSDFKKKSPNRRYIPGKLVIENGKACILTAESQGNGMLSPLNNCDIIANIEAGNTGIEKDTLLDAVFIFR
ncbi:molybdopterin molybdochelatase [Acetitomaculum ruminis DSM 5522]|uniref:Molybdopterin molybdenumtransferase n=1 Tax=Acetitomaculum ruminis DSM 5522 TaxID=1120918 RepID=A0A1I0V0J2_9FIRM|nr:gephyrin-like molybdotransferase Glp [Acetitomaculum ruminis]SFA69056.1 molybdopterin molybdochelatase [Acetitomaculum ruminis DSM 5522]